MFVHILWDFSVSLTHTGRLQKVADAVPLRFQMRVFQLYELIGGKTRRFRGESQGEKSEE